MIKLSPKALRFARLAAEERSAADESRIADLRRKESDHLADGRGDPLKGPGYLLISDDLARFCLKNIRSILEKPTVSEDEWDDNDLMFLEAVSTHLSESLSAGRKA